MQLKMQEMAFGTTNEIQREFWIEQRLKEIPEGSTILDAGAGDQHHKKQCEHLKYVSQDFAKYDGKGTQTGLQTGTYNYGDLDIVSDITKIPREDASFDAVLCSEVLEHVPYPDLVIKELSRLLKPNGKLILTAPFCSLTHFAPYHFATGFNYFWYLNVLPKYGLQATMIQSYGNYFEYLAQELYRTPYIVQTTCKDKIFAEEDKQTLLKAIEVLAKHGKQENVSNQLLVFGFLVIGTKSFS